MPLTDTAVRQLRAGPKPRKITDEKGLYVEVAPSGGKWWRLKYRIHGKENRLSLGVYPAVSLKMARERRDEARRLVAQGVDPSAHRKAAKRIAVERAANDFESVAREWFTKNSSGWATTDGVCRGIRS